MLRAALIAFDVPNLNFNVRHVLFSVIIDNQSAYVVKINVCVELANESELNCQGTIILKDIIAAICNGTMQKC